MKEVIAYLIIVLLALMALGGMYLLLRRMRGDHHRREMHRANDRYRKLQQKRSNLP